MYDLIMFDLDGTLTIPEEGITKCVKYALEAFGIIEEDMDKLRRFIGPPLVDGFMEFYGMTKEEAVKAVEKYRERFATVGIFENKLIDGVPKMLEMLKQSGKMLALATSKPAPYAKKIIEKFGIDSYFDILSCAELDGTRNDKAEVVKDALRKAEKFENPVMVGDRMHDVIGAKKNNIPCIGVSFGYAAEGELERSGAIKVVNSIDELTDVLIEN